ADHFHLVEGAGGQREQGAANAVTLGLLDLPDIAQRNHRLDEMKSGAVMQSNALAQVGERDAFAIARHLFKDGEGAADRLKSAPRAILNVVIDVGRCIFDDLHDRPAPRRTSWFRARFRFRSASQNMTPIAW